MYSVSCHAPRFGDKARRGRLASSYASGEPARLEGGPVGALVLASGADLIRDSGLRPSVTEDGQHTVPICEKRSKTRSSVNTRHTQRDATRAVPHRAARSGEHRDVETRVTLKTCSLLLFLELQRLFSEISSVN